MNNFNFLILSSDGKKDNYDVNAIYVNLVNKGITGFLPGHLPFVGLLDISTLYVLKDSEKIYYSISGGIIDVKQDKIILLVETFENIDEIDKNRAIKKKEENEKMLQNMKKDEKDYKLIELSLKKALNRLSLFK